LYFSKYGTGRNTYIEKIDANTIGAYNTSTLERTPFVTLNNATVSATNLLEGVAKLK